MDVTDTRRRSATIAPVRISDIERASGIAGYDCGWDRPGAPDDVILGGKFEIHQYADGMGVHLTSGVEKTDISSTFRGGPALQIFLLLDGFLAFSVDGETCELGVDDGVSVEAGLIWSRTRTANIVRHSRRGRAVSKIAITLEPAFFEDLDVPIPGALDRFRKRHMAQTQWCPSERALRNAHDIVGDRGESALLRRITIHRLALEIVHEAFSLFDSEADPRPEDTLLRRASEIRVHLDRTLDRDLPLSTLARAMGMSVTVLQDSFRQTYGLTIGEYRRKQRLVRSHADLCDHGMAIADAARRAGYTHAASFSTAFSRFFGYPPSRARR